MNTDCVHINTLYMEINIQITFSYIINDITNYTIYLML